MPFDDEQLRVLMDERGISRLLIAFSRCIDTKDFDGYASLYSRDGELVTPWGGHRGRDGLADHVRYDLGHYSRLHHVSAAHDISLDGDRAEVRATLLATHVVDESGERFWSVGGHYEIQVVREDDVWRFARVEIKPAWRFDTTDPKEQTR